MAWNNTAVTTAGNALLQRVLAGEQLSLDYAAGGSGTVDTASLMTQTALYEQKQHFNIAGISKVSNGQKINIQILNTGLLSAYTMQQIGVWAHIGSDAPVLFALLQDENGIDIPAESDVVDFSLNFYAVIDFSGQSEFLINVDPSALVTHAVMLEALSKKADKTHLQKIADGGTGATTEAEARKNLGVLQGAFDEISKCCYRMSPVDNTIEWIDIPKGEYLYSDLLVDPSQIRTTKRFNGMHVYVREGIEEINITADVQKSRNITLESVTENKAIIYGIFATLLVQDSDNWAYQYNLPYYEIDKGYFAHIRGEYYPPIASFDRSRWDLSFNCKLPMTCNAKLYYRVEYGLLIN